MRKLERIIVQKLLGTFLSTFRSHTKWSIRSIPTIRSPFKKDAKTNPEHLRMYRIIPEHAAGLQYAKHFDATSLTKSNERPVLDGLMCQLYSISHLEGDTGMHTEHAEDGAVADDIQRHVLRPAHRIRLAHVLLSRTSRSRHAENRVMSFSSSSNSSSGTENTVVGSN